MDNQQSQRVLVFCLSGLGDVIMASPALSALSTSSNQFKLTLLTMFPSVREYLQDQRFTDDNRFIDFLHAAKINSLANLDQLRRERFDVSVIPYAMNRIEYNLVARVINSKFRIGFRYQKQRQINLPILNHCIIEEDPTLHAVEENLRWASILTKTPISEFSSEMSFRISAESNQEADAFLSKRDFHNASPLIGVHTSCNPLKNQQRRCWPVDRFEQLIRNLASQIPSARFILFEGPQDQQLPTSVRNNVRLVAVAESLSLNVVGALISRCDLFISNISGLMHVAAANKIPTVAIYGPTNPVWDYPWKTDSIIVSQQLPCSPCYSYSSHQLSCHAHLNYSCVRELPVEKVEKSALKLLSLA